MSDALQHPRLVSLDILRGLTVIGMIMVNASAELHYSREVAVFPALLHSHWNGLQLADIVFPAFLMMVGIAIPFALGRYRESYKFGDSTTRRVMSRMTRLLVAGFLLSNIYWFQNFESGQWRLFGVLQRIGLVYGACALLFLSTSSRTRLIIAAAILLLYWPLIMIPAPDGLAYNIGIRGHNFAAYVDRLLLGGGNHIYVTGPEGYDPEGLLGTLPAIAHGLIGVAIGSYLQTASAAHRGRNMMLVGVAMLAAGMLFSTAFPVIKDIWSSSFVLVTAGLTTLALAGLSALSDRDRSGHPRWLARVAIVFGTNAMAAYAIHMVTGGVMLWDVVMAPYEAIKARMPVAVSSLIPVVSYIMLIWIAVRVMNKRGWILKL
jgi:predicted acyltransferase